MKKILLPVLIFSLAACVKITEPDDGLIINNSSFTSSQTAFSYNLNAEDYTFNETYNLSVSINDTNSVLISTILVQDYAGGDTARISLFDANDLLLRQHQLTGDGYGVLVDTVRYFKPKMIQFTGRDFTGVLEFILAKP